MVLLWVTWIGLDIVAVAGYVKPSHGQRAGASGPGSWAGSLLEEVDEPCLQASSDVGRLEAP